MRIKVALITGGFTEEAQVSFKSSDFVRQHLDEEIYEVYLITITNDSWFHVDDNGVRFAINKDDFTLHMETEVVTFDVAFIMIHGSPGEDGRLQGYLDLVGLKYTSCGTLTSALTMNKSYTKAVLSDIPELHLAKSVQLFDDNRSEASRLIVDSLRLPYFVKPNAGGSSIGMTKVLAKKDLPDALTRAFEAENTGRQVIVEEFVEGREFSQGAYRNLDGDLIVLPATEVITSREFFDYEAKYTPGLTQEITPADLTEEQKNTAARIIQQIYVRLDCRGMVRVDYFIEKDTGRFYFIEINTIPGQTAQSFIPQQVRAAGMNETDFYGELIAVALQENRE